MSLDNFVTYYLDYRNNFLTVEAFAEWYGFSMETAKVIVECGRAISNIELQIINSNACIAQALGVKCLHKQLTE